MNKVIVVGAGASGLMAAYSAAKNGNNVVVLEKNEKAGKKIYITGKGRCNITNDSDPDAFLENVVHGKKFLIRSIYSFPPERTMRFLEDGGLPLKVERGNRVFPLSDKASDVTKCLECYCRDANVDFRFGARVTDICRKDGGFCVRTTDNAYAADAVIIATGGVSYPSTGSTGDGYVFAERCGINTVPRRAALCGIACDVRGLAAAQGLSLKNVRIEAERDGKTVGSFFGEMLFTHFGVSGPIVLSLSSLLNDSSLDNVVLIIDLKPALDEETLDRRILRDFESRKNKQIGNALDALLPKALILPVLERAKIRPDLPVHSVTKEQRAALLRSMKRFVLTNCSLRPIEEAIVTAGGVDLKEIDPKTMQSKKIPNLYFCGEVLDVDALTGGFNLQIALSTGFTAGNSI